jgi:primosomal protein N' (replication factor Y)
MPQDLFATEDEPTQDTAARQPVLVTSPVNKSYDYAVADGQAVEPGSYVLVPLGPREVIGTVWDADPSATPPKKLKFILHVFDIPPMPKVHRDFLKWVAQYNMADLGSVLKMAIPVPQALDPQKALTAYVLKEPRTPHDSRTPHPTLSPEGRGLGERTSLNPKYQKIIDLMQDGLPRRQSELIEQAGVTASVVKTMLKHGLIETIDLFASAPCRAPNLNNTHILSPAQREAADTLTARVKAEEFEAFLLDGVTGSGKTEVYYEAIAEVVKKGGQAVILLPEIALSNSFIGRFKERFGVAPALWHSSLSPAQRRVTWRGIVSGETKVVVGARSALFLPYAELGLIVIDEEHDPAFKQEEGVLYNARDMAVVRAHLGKIPAVLVSATPSLETMQNAWAGRYTLLKLPDRFGGADHPDMTVVDLRQDKPERQHFISPVIKDAIAATIGRKEQSLLFLNRRGYAPLTLCRTCGHRFECPRCTAWLVEHKKTGKLQCHHCGFATKIPDACPECHDVNSLAVCGPGVERIAEEVKEYFPNARTMILASDVTDTHEKLRVALAAIQNHEVDIIIGTQIIAKGHHFPKLTTVGVIDADLGLSGGDLRASERTFQLLHQVAGRAGREHLKGTVYLQTYAPEHRVIQMIAKDDRDNFLRTEALERERAKMPPYSRLAGIILTGPNETQVKDIAHTIGKAAPSGPGVRILGPAPAQMFRIRGNYRYRLLVQADKTINIQKMIGDWLEGIKIPSKVKLAVDVDPQSFL